MDPEHPLLSIETTFSRLKTMLYEQQEQLTWNEKLKYFDDFRLTFWNLDLLNKAISTRLPKPANGKREFLGYLDLVNSNNLNSQSFDNDAAQRQDLEKDLRYSKVLKDTQCTRERRLQVNYEPGSMPSKSPGNSRLRRQHRRTKSKSSQREVPESPDAHTPSRPPANKIVDPDSDNDAEDESESLHQSTGKVLPSLETTNIPTRLEPNPTIEGIPIPAEEKTSWDDEEGVVTGIWSAKNTSRKTRRAKRERKAEVIDLEERDSPPKTPRPKSHKGNSVGVEGGEVDANTQEHNERTKPTSEPWAAGRETLARILGKVLPEFQLVPTLPKSASTKNPPGEVEPELTDSMSRVYGRGGVMNGGPKPVNRLSQKQPFVVISQTKRTADKAFDFTNGSHSSNILAQPQYENKRQRTDDRASGSIIERELIDVDSPPPRPRSSTVLSKTRQGGRKNGNISSMEEYSSVEETVNPRKGESSRFFRHPVPKKPSNSHEDEQDPIVDPDMTSHRSNGKESRDSYLPDGSYTGNSRRVDSRPRPSMWKANSHISKSKILPSHPDDLLVKKPSSNSAKRKNDSAGSPDELAEGHDSKKRTAKNENPEKTEAEVLLKAARGDLNGGEVIVELDDTDDETAAKKADIGPVPLKKPKKPTKNDDEHRFTLIDAFSTLGLMKPASNQWRFVLKKGEKIFRIIDNDEEVQYEIPTRSLQKFEWSEYSPKLILYRLADGDFQGPSRAFLELKSIDDSSELRELLLKLESTLTAKYKRDAVFLNKVFLRDRVKKVLPKPGRQRTPEDVQLIGKNTAMRQAQKRAEEQDLKQKGKARVTNPAQQTSQFVEPRRAEGLARKMASSVNADTIAPDKFYDNSSHRGTEHSPAPLATRSSTRNLPRRELAYQERTRSPTPPPVAKWTVDHPGWEENWLDTIIYPPGPGHKRTATVERGDIQRLDEEEFLNDNLVNFYLRFLEYDLEQNRPDVARRIYFQNSFFYERLTTPAAGSKKGINYAAVQRWTKGVDLFSKDYIIVPVCENIHWYVAIICNATKLLKPDVVEEAVETKTPTKTNIAPKEDAPASHSGPVNPEDVGDPMKMDSLQNSLEECLEHEKLAVESPDSRRNVQESNLQHETNPPESHLIANNVSDLEPTTAENPALAKPTRKPPADRSLKAQDPNTPRIIILDSLGGGHPVTSKNLRDYLVAEMKDKHGKEINPPGNRQMHFAAKNLEFQKNYSDCGLFLLSYIRKFLEDPESYISGILGKEGESDRIQPKKMREDIRTHLFELQMQSPKKRKRPSKPSDVAKAVHPRPASRDASGATCTGIQNRTEFSQTPPIKRTAEMKNPPSDVALPPANASTNTTHSPKNVRLLKPAPPIEGSAKMTKQTSTRSHKVTNGTGLEEIMDLANGTNSERTPGEKPIVHEGSNSKRRTKSHPNLIDDEQSSTLHDLAGSSQVLTPKESEYGSRMTTFLKGVGETMIDSVNGFMRGQAAKERDDTKDIGNSVLSPFEIDDSPAKPGRKRDKNQQKRRSRSPSVEEFTPSKRQRSSPKPSRDSRARYERGNVHSDQVLEPPSPALRSPDFGDSGQIASEPSSTTTAQKNGNKFPDGQNGDDEMLLLGHATEACKPKPSTKKSSSPTTENSQRQGSFSPLKEFDFDEMREDEEDRSAAPVIPGAEAGNGRPHSQKSSVGSGKHTFFS